MDDYQEIPCEIEDGMIHVPSMTVPAHLESELVNLIVAELLREDVLDAEFILDDILDAEYLDIT